MQGGTNGRNQWRRSLNLSAKKYFWKEARQMAAKIIKKKGGKRKKGKEKFGWNKNKHFSYVLFYIFMFAYLIKEKEKEKRNKISFIFLVTITNEYYKFHRNSQNQKYFSLTNFSSSSFSQIWKQISHISVDVDSFQFIHGKKRSS